LVEGRPGMSRGDKLIVISAFFDAALPRQRLGLA
jgi:hypothetical protein